MPRKIPRLMNADELWEYSLRTLGRRAHSISELREKLKRRAEEPAAIDDVLSRLKQIGYLNDRKYADMVSTSRLENQGFGKARVLRELRQRRVAPTVAEQSVAATFEGVDEISLIEAFIARKFRNIDLKAYLADPKKLASAYRKLRLAGFSSGNSIRVLKRFANELEHLEELEQSEEATGIDVPGGLPE